MKEVFVEDKTFNAIDFSKKTLEKGEYFSCIFKNCNFFESDLSNIIFEDCEFRDCNLSSVKVNNTSFQGAYLKDCKILAVLFSNINPFLNSFYFDNCNLNYSSFYKLKLISSRFMNSQLEEVDFVEADLISCNFSKSNLQLTKFENTKIDKADFRTAINFAIDLELNSHQKTIFSKENLEGLLSKYNIIIE